MILAVITMLGVATFTPEAALSRAMQSSAEWTMTRKLPGSLTALRSSGTVKCELGKGIEWKTLKPFEMSVTMTTNAMIFVDEDGVRTKTLEEMPHYSELRLATDAFVGGDRTAFDEVFEISTELEKAGWRLSLKPKIGALKFLFTEIELMGAELPKKVVMRSGDGGESVIEFVEKPSVD